MSIIAKLENDSVNLVQQTQRGIHPAETEHHIRKLETQLEQVKQMVHYLVDLRLNYTEDMQDSAIGAKIQRDHRSLARICQHLMSAISHLRGHDWGIFRK